MKQKAWKITEADILEGAIKDFWGSNAYFHSGMDIWTRDFRTLAWSYLQTPLQ